jgi:ABC-type phosphate transport system permease subunit
MLLSRNIKEKLIENFFLVIAASSIFIILFIFYFLFQGALPAFQNLGVDLFGTEWSVSQGKFGLTAAIFGTLIVTAGAMLIAIPLGILGAIFLGLVAVIPSAVESATRVQTFRGLGATSLLILVGVAIDTAKQVQTYVISQRYEGMVKQ